MRLDSPHPFPMVIRNSLCGPAYLGLFALLRSGTVLFIFLVTSPKKIFAEEMFYIFIKPTVKTWTDYPLNLDSAVFPHLHEWHCPQSRRTEEKSRVILYFLLYTLYLVGHSICRFSFQNWSQIPLLCHSIATDLFEALIISIHSNFIFLSPPSSLYKSTLCHSCVLP